MKVKTIITCVEDLSYLSTRYKQELKEMINSKLVSYLMKETVKSGLVDGEFFEDLDDFENVLISFEIVEE